MEAEGAYAGRPSGAAGTSSPPIAQGHAGPDRFASVPREVRRAAAAVFAILVLATAGGLFLAQRIKHTPTSVQGFALHPAAFSPARGSTEQVSFRTAKNDKVTVAIVGASGETVATLVRNLAWPRYLRLCLTWNGRRGGGHVTQGAATRPAAGICPAEPAFAQPGGRLAPAGDYRVRVTVHRGQSVLSPSSFALVGAASSSR